MKINHQKTIKFSWFQLPYKIKLVYYSKYANKTFSVNFIRQTGRGDWQRSQKKNHHNCDKNLHIQKHPYQEGQMIFGNIIVPLASRRSLKLGHMTLVYKTIEAFLKVSHILTLPMLSIMNVKILIHPYSCQSQPQTQLFNENRCVCPIEKVKLQFFTYFQCSET